MGIELYRHNLEAYNSAVLMLEETSEACIVHPTGTGKSFIGFKLAEDHPENRVLWLSPSEYIYNTQIENLKKTAEPPENIIFCTYARLMNLTDEEIAGLSPEYIILDEFHRCGAEMWGAGVTRLLAAFPEAYLLGLSATAVRYLDNRRNMANELFGGNIASEMTLGEAIALGIIQAPKYVLALYSYRDDLERYERRAKSARSRITRDRAEWYLEKLRRLLENAEGVGDIFKKHIKSIDSKFIVFCSGYEHMITMMNKCRKWLRDIDAAPRIYSVYTLENDSEKQFTDFKNDNDHSHIRLLFCIDALNEGIHVDGISGVMLLRPTVSPIVFKQQIGRALTAAGKSVPLIFDIVNNIENLYSVGSVQDEITKAMFFYESTGRGDLIVNDTFRVTDEVAEVRSLFAGLDDVLSAGWDQMYELAREYYRENGTIEMPARTRYRDYPLANWLREQRKRFIEGALEPERREKLDRLGIRWMSQIDENFEIMYRSAKEYYNSYGNLRVPDSYVDPDGNKLGGYIYYLRESERYKRKSFLTEEQKRMLTDIGMDWTWSRDREWDDNYSLLKEYIERNGADSAVPAEMVTASGGSLRYWKAAQISAYRKGRLSSEKTAKLEKLGLRLGVTDRWMSAYDFALNYYNANGHLNFPSNSVHDGIWMASWIRDQKDAYLGKSKRVLTAEQKDLLEAIGIGEHRSAAERRWRETYDFLKAYIKKTGDKSFSYPNELSAPNKTNIRQWIKKQRENRKNGVLSEEKARLLDEIGFIWSMDLFQEGLEHAEEYVKEHGNLRVNTSYVCGDGYRLGSFIKGDRARGNSGRLSDNHRKQLDSLGMIWNAGDDKFYAALEDCKEYSGLHGNLQVPIDVVGKSGVKLNYWIADCRRKLKAGKFDAEKTGMLRDIGITA